MKGWFLDVLTKFYGAIYATIGFGTLTEVNANWLDYFRGGNSITMIATWVLVINAVYYVHKYKTQHRHKGKLKQLEESNTIFKVVAILIRQVIYLTIIFNVVCMLIVLSYFLYLVWRFIDEKVSLWNAPHGTMNRDYERGRASGRKEKR